MNNDDGWDWRWLYFTGTTLLGMSEKTFWRTTPRKLAALSEVYTQFKAGSSDATNVNPTGFIDQVL